MHLETHLPFLFDLFLKSTAVLALAAFLMAAFRRASAANRHAITVAALFTLLLLPFTKLAQPRWSLALNQPAPAVPVTIKLPPITTMASSEGGQDAAMAVPVNAPVKAAGIRVNWSAVGVGVWLAGFALVLMHRAGVGCRLRRLAAESRGIKEGRVLAIARDLAASCGVGAEIRESDTCRVPLAFGVWRPTVLLPSEAMGWSDGRLSAALQHEFGHIRRRDCLTRWFADLACAFYWMNPLVWLGARALRLAQEQACDDVVLNAGTRPDDYATQLVEVVRSLQGDRFTARHALAMAQPSTLETRVRAIVDESRDRSARSVRGALAGIAFATASLALCTAAQLRGAEKKNAAPAVDERAPQVDIEVKFLEITGAPKGLPDLLKEDGKEKNGAPRASMMPDTADKALKALMRTKGVDLLSSPRIITVSKHQAKIEIIREFRHATAWEKDSKSGEWKPTIFDTKNLGVTFDVTPEVNADGTIDLEMTPEVVEFAGFQDLDGDATKVFGKPDTGKPLSERLTEGPAGIGIPEGHRAQALFNTRKMSTNVNVSPGMTVVLGGMEQGGAAAGGKQPQRRLVVLVTARIAKPGGIPEEKPVNVHGNPGGKKGAATEPKPLEILSDKMSLDKKTGTLSATGNVRIETAQAVIKADSVEITPKKDAANAGDAKADAKWILPKVDFRDATLREVVEFLVTKSRTLDPAGKGVNIVLRNAEKIGDVKITLSVTDIPLTEVLRYVAALANCEMVKEEFAFVIMPMQAGKAPAPNADRAKGAANAPAAPAPERPESAALKKAHAIIFPKVELRDATLAETVDFLSRKSKDLDPDKQGVNFILKTGAGESPKITVSLNNVPLIEVIKYVTQIAGCEFVADDHAITFRPAAK